MMKRLILALLLASPLHASPAEEALEAMAQIEARLSSLESRPWGGLDSDGEWGKGGYLPIKNLIPNEFDSKLEEWKQWKEDVEEIIRSHCVRPLR